MRTCLFALTMGIGPVGERNSLRPISVVQSGICYGGQFGTKSNVGRLMGVL